MTITVIVADDHALVRSGIATIVAQSAGIEVVAEAADGVQAVAQYRLYRPDVVLMDLSMPVMDGVEATAAIRREFAEARVLIVSNYRYDERVAAALMAGAQGYLDKSAARTELIDAIRALHAGLSYFSGGVR